MAWIISAFLATALGVLIFKLAVIRKDMKNLTRLVDESISLGISEEIVLKASDGRLKELVALLNCELSRMRELKTDYIAGDRELKEAVTNIAHDLRTPLTAIYGYIDLMSKTDDPAEMKKYVAAIENRVAAITHLTEELYEFTVISSSGTREAVPTDIRRLLEDTLIASYPLFEQNGITPDVKTPDRAVYRSVDPDALSRVFTNIISNAEKYSENGFSVTMTEDCEIIFSNRASGLTDIDVSKLFDRFFTVDPSRRSTGLGLSIAKALVEQMGGVIFADYSGEILSITVRFD